MQNKVSYPEVTSVAASKLAAIGGDLLAMSDTSALEFVKELRHKRLNREALLSARKPKKVKVIKLLKSPSQTPKQPKAPKPPKEKRIKNEQAKIKEEVQDQGQGVSEKKPRKARSDKGKKRGQRVSGAGIIELLGLDDSSHTDKSSD